MNIETRHLVLTTDGRLQEFSAEQAALVAAGVHTVPEFARQRVRYLQISFKDETDEEVSVQTAGACIEFDEQGKLCGTAAPVAEVDQLSRFEYDTCVQWALKNLPATSITFH